MNEIKIGEYVRTKKGQFDKVCTVLKDEGIVRCEKNRYWLENIKNHKEKLLDLIEEGDILEYQIYNLSFTKIGKVKKYKDAISFKEYLGVESFNLEQITILRILTKERFKEESYKVEV